MTTLYLLLATLAPAGDSPPGFQQVRIATPYREHLLARPVLMETAGATFVTLGDGRVMVLGVGMVALADDSARALVDAYRVAELKALLSVARQQRGVQVSSQEVVRQRTVLALDNGRETGKSTTEVLSLTQARSQGSVGKGLSRVGTWRSPDGKLFYLAVGMLVDAPAQPQAPTTRRKQP